MPSNLLLGNPIQSFNEGQAIGRQNRFNALAGQAVAAPADQRAGLIAQAAQADPVKALAVNGALSKQDDTDEDRRNKAIVNMARFYVSAPDAAKPQVRAQLAPSLAKFGIDVTSVSPEDFDKTAQALVEAWTPTSATPTGFREFDMKARAAGLKPGTPEYEQAARVALGTEGRASNAGYGFEQVEGADGRKYLQRRNPRTGAVEVYDPATGDFAPVGGGPAPTTPSDPTIVGPIQTQPVMQGAPQADTSPVDDANRWLKAGVPEQEVGVRLAAKYGQQLGGAKYPSVVIRNGIASAGTAGGAPPRAPADPSLLVSRAPEDTAAATENAKQGVQLAYLPQTERIKADASVDEATRTARAKAEVDAGAKRTADAAQRQKDAQDTLNLLDEAEKILPNATGSAGGRLIDNAAAAVGKSTTGAQATAQLQTIAGQLTSKMPRMQGPQSDNDVLLYKQMAGDLANPNLPVETRRAAARTIRELNQKYAAGGGQGYAAPPAPATTGNFGHLWN